jgi:hypothetical protein
MALIGYVEEADFTAYAAARGITLLRPVAETLLLGLDYIELQSYSGYKTDPVQVLEFPRDESVVIPDKIKTAQMEVALIYDKNADPLAAVGQKVLSKSVDGSVSISYSDSGSGLTRYPKVDKLLSGFLGGLGGNQFTVSRA